MSVGVVDVCLFAYCTASVSNTNFYYLSAWCITLSI